MWNSESSVAVACCLPDRAKDLSAPLYIEQVIGYKFLKNHSATWSPGSVKLYWNWHKHTGSVTISGNQAPNFRVWEQFNALLSNETVPE